MQAFVERVISPVKGFVMRPIRSLHQAAYLLAALTLASQVLALLRDRTFAHTFGAGHELDLYYAAFRIPDLVFALVSSLVSAYVLIPRITESTRESAKRLLSESAMFLVLLGGLLSLVLLVYMPNVLTVLYPDLMRSTSAETFVALSRLLLIQPLLLGLSGVLSSVTQVHRRFVLFALSPVLYNLGIIIGAIWLYPLWGLFGIGFGVLLGAVAYLLVNVPVVVGAGMTPTFVLPRLKNMLPILRDSVPRSLTLGVGSVTLLGLTALASRSGTGSIALFTFASNLEQVPLGIIGASYAVAAFPALAAVAGEGERAAFTNILSASARHVILWSMVALGLMVVLRAHLVRAILGTGAFDWDATRLTAALLVLLVLALAAQGLILLFSRALYAARQSWRPLLYQVIGGVVTFGAAFALISFEDSSFSTTLAYFLKVGDLQHESLLMIALAATLGQFVLVGLLLVALKTVTPGLARTLVRPLIDGLLAACVGGAVAYGVLAFEGGIAPLTTLAAVVLQGVVAGIAGLVAAGAALAYLENEEFSIVVASLVKLVRRKEERSEALVPSGEEYLRHE